jgi:hypothetical protein
MRDQGRIVEPATPMYESSSMGGSIRPPQGGESPWTRGNDDLLRKMLRGWIIFLVGAGLIAVVYALRPDVPLGSATTRSQQPATPAWLASTATPRPISTGPTPDAFVRDAVEPTSSDFVQKARRASTPIKPHAELARKPQSVGWGDSYAVRLLTSSGEPLVVSQIVLIAHMTDGTVENIAMGALPQRGIYRATVPTRRSAPISLQVRVSYREQWVELPVRR